MVVVVAEDAGQDLIAQSMKFVDLTIPSSVWASPWSSLSLSLSLSEMVRPLSCG